LKPYIKYYFAKWAVVKRAKPEDTICLAICNELRALVVGGKFNGLFFHVENEGNGGRSHQLNLLKKASGKMAGVSDYVFCRDGLTLFVEIKTEKGKQGASQVMFESWCDDFNLPYHICRSWLELKILLKKEGFINE
tara:strand:+ start:202 stop:609 length:408 start_codon:yes stop_codon:yes gene_type:complete